MNEAARFKDGESYSSCDGGETWFQMGRGSAPKGVNIKHVGPRMTVSRVDTERNIIYYVAEPSK